MLKQRTQIVLNKVKEAETPNGWTEYEEKDEKDRISFQAGEEPWTWSIKTDSPLLKKFDKKIIECYVKQGLKQHEYKGGFKQATEQLVINI